MTDQTHKITFGTQDECIELLKIICVRKFNPNDTLATLSQPLNKIIDDLMDLTPDLTTQLEPFRDQAILTFQEDSQTWDWLQKQSVDQQKHYVYQYFTPLQPYRPLGDLTSKETVIDAYRP
ncbi:hypothetical protein [Parasulfitobacter algicola]|uniref:Uncharacterized protein n=1 Tax=Parasulfitobacter algicola TaxID=2614809 RepID=A0ABX2J043_9RHOB|nr:hypothetical protein [Sulfitobacter algicola]NSX56063.1 hypothetical protein [Sulfitobacter algicola]